METHDASLVTTPYIDVATRNKIVFRLVKQGGLNKKEIQLNLCNIFSIFMSNEL